MGLLAFAACAVAGYRAALLGLDDRFHNVIHKAIALESPDATSICIAHFDELWNERQTRRILGPAGIDEEGIDRLRDDLA